MADAHCKVVLGQVAVVERRWCTGSRCIDPLLSTFVVEVEQQVTLVDANNVGILVGDGKGNWFFEEKSIYLYTIEERVQRETFLDEGETIELAAGFARLQH